MKFTLTRTDLKNQMHMSVKKMESFVERMKTETKNQEVSHLREHLRRRMAHRSCHAAADTESGRPARRAGKPHQLRAHACQHRGHA